LWVVWLLRVPPDAVGDVSGLLGLRVGGQLGQRVGEAAWYGGDIGVLDDGECREAGAAPVGEIFDRQEVGDILFFHDALDAICGRQRAAGREIGQYRG